MPNDKITVDPRDIYEVIGFSQLQHEVWPSCEAASRESESGAAEANKQVVLTKRVSIRLSFQLLI